MTGPVEWLVGLVLGVDALVIAGLLVSRLSGRSRRQNGSTAADDVSVDRLHAYTASGSTAPATAVEERRAAGDLPGYRSVAPAPATTDFAYEQLADVTAGEREAALEGGDGLVDATDAPASEIEEASGGTPLVDPDAPDGNGQQATAPVDGSAQQAWPQDASLDDGSPDGTPPDDSPLAAATDWDAAVAETPAIPEASARPIGLDFGPTWVDPAAMAAEAAAEWRRALRRDLALAAWRGRPGLVMNLKLDVEDQADLSIAEVARLEAQLHQTIGRSIRATDHFDRTGPGRFHIILSEMSEAAAQAVAERIRHAFVELAGPVPRLLIGWAAMETEADIALALQRAAERLDGVPAPPTATGTATEPAATAPAPEPPPTIEPRWGAQPTSNADPLADAETSVDARESMDGQTPMDTPPDRDAPAGDEL